MNLNAAPNGHQSHQRPSNVKLYFNFPFNYHKEDNLAVAELNLFLYNILVDCKLQASAARTEAPIEKVRTVS